MVIGPKKLLKLVKEINLVENLAKRELTNPEGAGFDLRLGEVYQIKGKAFLGIEERQTPAIELLAKYDPQKKQSFIFEPGEYYLVTTIEKINLPLDICAVFIPRTTTFRSGLFLRTGIAQPGYQGKLTFGLKNEGPVPVELELGARFVFAVFHWVDGGGEKYRGQWQGGRVTTEKKEKQV
ncbi:MAG: 2'-deoxycytidine 5'-triphosphate deaminase [Patescibacteria group bacterium]|nr:2'-deoxycytidine 5'-triphosphate deaminase [Patescibacteria group bacterium]